jgi:predicted metalloendopeptidase
MALFFVPGRATSAGRCSLPALAFVFATHLGATEMPKPVAHSEVALTSGIDEQFIDPDVRLQDDFYRHVNGKWLLTKEIPADKGIYTMFERVNDLVEGQLHELVDGLLQHVDDADPDQQKIVDLYASFMDENALQPIGFKPLLGELARIDQIKDKTQIAALIGHFNRMGVVAPYVASVRVDARDSTKYTFDLRQGGLGMPDRDYYLKDDEKLKAFRAQYRQHVERMLALIGDPAPAGNAEAIVALETALAKVQWTKVENRNPIKTNNKFAVAKLSTVVPDSKARSRISMLPSPATSAALARSWSRRRCRSGGRTFAGTCSVTWRHF